VGDVLLKSGGQEPLFLDFEKKKETGTVAAKEKGGCFVVKGGRLADDLFRKSLPVLPGSNRGKRRG